MNPDVKERARRFAKSGSIEIRLCANGVIIGTPYRASSDSICAQSDLLVFTNAEDFHSFLSEFFNGRERD